MKAVAVKSGIYAWRCAVEGTRWFNQYYVGQAVDLNVRPHDHPRLLKLGRHNKKFQEFWDTCGQYHEEPIELELLVECSREEMNEWEILFIEILESFELGFNATKGGTYKEDHGIECTLTNIYTNETRTENSIEEFARMTGIWPNCISSVLRGEQEQAEGWYDPRKGKLSLYKAIDSQGNLHEFYNAKIFADKHGIPYSNFIRMLNEGRRTARGWTRPNLGPILNRKYYELLNPQNEIFKGYNPKKLCDQLNLCYDSILQLINGKINLYLGWRRVDCPEGKYKKFVEYELRSPSGEIVKGSNLNEFERRYGLNHRMISGVVSGKRKSHKGWQRTDYTPQPRKYRDITLKHQNGETIRVFSLQAFASSKGLKYWSLRRLIKGDLLSVEGWTICTEKEPENPVL